MTPKRKIFENPFLKCSRDMDVRVVAKFSENHPLGSWRNVIWFGRKKQLHSSDPTFCPTGLITNRNFLRTFPKLLKLTAECKRCMKKSRFATNIWLRHRSLLDRCVLSTLERSTMPYSTWASSVSCYKCRRATHQWILFMTQTDDATPMTNCRKKTFDPHVDTPKHIATKREDTSRAQLYNGAKFRADR